MKGDRPDSIMLGETKTCRFSHILDSCRSGCFRICDHVSEGNEVTPFGSGSWLKQSMMTTGQILLQHQSVSLQSVVDLDDSSIWKKVTKYPINSVPQFNEKTQNRSYYSKHSIKETIDRNKIQVFLVKRDHLSQGDYLFEYSKKKNQSHARQFLLQSFLQLTFVLSSLESLKSLSFLLFHCPAGFLQHLQKRRAANPINNTAALKVCHSLKGVTDTLPGQCDGTHVQAFFRNL